MVHIKRMSIILSVITILFAGCQPLNQEARRTPAQSPQRVLYHTDVRNQTQRTGEEMRRATQRAAERSPQAGDPRQPARTVPNTGERAPQVGDPRQPVRNVPRTGEQMRDVTPRNQRPIFNQKAADRLVNLATQVPRVKRAASMVVGNYSIVGIDVDANLDRGQVGTIKYSVARAIKNDPVGTNALVTADADLVQRLREMRKSIQEGQPVDGMMNELADIAGRIAPQPTGTTR